MSSFEPVRPVRTELAGATPTLLNVSRELPGTSPITGEQIRWTSGVSSRQESCSTHFLWPLCPGPEQEDKCAPTPATYGEFEPVMLERLFECDQPNSSEDRAETEAEYQRRLQASSPSLLGQMLWEGNASSSNPSLQSTAVDLSGGGVVVSSIVGAVGTLLQAFEDTLTGVQPVVHIPKLLIAAAESENVAAQSGGVLQGASGTYWVSPGPGYRYDEGPLDAAPVPAPIPAPAGSAWIFISGPAEYALSPTRVVWEQPDRRTNFVSGRVQRMGLIRFDTCGVFAALASVNG
jgi:hypothetical protein